MPSAVQNKTVTYSDTNELVVGCVSDLFPHFVSRDGHQSCDAGVVVLWPHLKITYRSR